MAALARLQTADCSLPTLDVYTQVNGLLTNVYALSYQIWDKSTGTPVQVFPATSGNKMAVDIANDCPTGGRLSTGHYVATWTVPAGENIGTHQIRWYIQLSPSVAEQIYIEEFEVLPDISASGEDPGYVTVADMRDEGVPTSISDALLARRINLASRFVEQATKRFFTPREMTIKVDGTGGAKILLSDPIIAIEEVLFDTTPWAPSATQIEMDLLRVYNRHLSQNLQSPDDRNNPKIELFHPSEMLTHYGSSMRSWSRLVFPEGQQNVTITGVFGYTDYDGANVQGKTPELIKHATKLIVIRELDRMTQIGARFDAQNRHRLTSERTRDQAYTLEALGNLRGYSFTGDPQIDNILANYLRPPALGAA